MAKGVYEAAGRNDSKDEQTAKWQPSRWLVLIPIALYAACTKILRLRLRMTMREER